MKIFISYKSENANIVRAVAERLISCGVDVWFAEYFVLLENYELFEQEIVRGVDQATHAIIFTNEKWAGSEYCNFEMDRILAKLGMTNILEVCVPKEEKPGEVYQILKDQDRNIISFKGNIEAPTNEDLDSLVRHIGEIFREISVSRMGVMHDFSNMVNLSRFGISLNTGPLKVVEAASTNLMLQDIKYFNSITFRAQIEGAVVTLRLFVTPFDSVIDNISIRQDGKSDDREVYTAYRMYAKGWVNRESNKNNLPSYIRVRGLHLVFIDGQSHMGLSSQQKTSTLELWERRYVISVKETSVGEKSKGKNGEVSLLFSIQLSGNEKSQIEKFSHLCQYFDAIAQSLRYKMPSGKTALLNNIPIFISKTTYLFAALFLMWFLLEEGKPPWILALSSSLVGLFGMDIIFFFRTPLYRRLLWLKQPLIDDILKQGSYERLSTDLFHWLMANPISILYNISYAFNKKLTSAILVSLTLFTIFSIMLYTYGMNDGRYLLRFFSGVCGLILGITLSWCGISNYISHRAKTD